LDGMGLEKEQMVQIQMPVTSGGDEGRISGVDDRGLSRFEAFGEGLLLSPEGRR
jgi:hypothetical protein